jgi:predicted component of type VI protein secretion system
MLPLVIQVMDNRTQTLKEYCFTHSPVRIGRNTLSDISLQEPFVSLVHAVVRFDEEALHLVDLGSTNGTLLNGKRVTKNEPVQMQAGQTVNIGHLSLRFSRGNATQARTRSSSQVTQFRAMAASKARLGEELAPAEPLSFKPTPKQARPPDEATSLLQSPLEDADSPRTTLLSMSDLQDSDSPRTTLMSVPDPEDPDSPRTTLMSASDLQALVAARGAERPSEPPLRRTQTGSSRTLTPSAAQRAPARPEKPVSNTLGPLYESYRQAWKVLHAALADNLEGLKAAERGEVLSQLSKEMPALVQEEQFQELVRSTGAAPPKPPTSNRLDVVSRELLEQFVRSYLPQARGLESEPDIDRFLDRLAEVLETFGRAFLELRQGHEQFGQQMAVPITNHPSPLYRAKNTREVMQYLLDWRGDGARVRELMSGFVDVMVHQIALLNGMREGVRGMLQRLSPEELEGGGGRNAFFQLGPLKIPAYLWPFRGMRRWATYVERHRAFMEEERELTAALFGPEFAKAYLAIIGEAAKKEGADGALLDALPTTGTGEHEDR